MPFNKGDFTQQGVAGDVTALVRLNEKRTVKLTLSADDESDNCDISGSVIDELNDKTYPIGSGVSGNIEITENGENINVAPYATATVNVAGGGSDLPVGKCSITIVNSAESTMNIDFTDSDTPIYINGDNFIADDNILWHCYAYLSETNPTVLTPGQSITFDCYYGGTVRGPYLSLTMPLSEVSTYAGTFSNITNMTEDSTSDYHGYVVTDYSADSACTLTVVCTPIKK